MLLVCAKHLGFTEIRYIRIFSYIYLSIWHLWLYELPQKNMAGKWRCSRCLYADELLGPFGHIRKKGGVLDMIRRCIPSTMLSWNGTIIRKLGNHHPSSHVFLSWKSSILNLKKKLYVTNSFICPRPPSFYQILDVQGIPQTCFLGKAPTHLLLFVPPSLFFWHVSKQTSLMAAGCVFSCQESADRDKVIPEKRKKLYGVGESEGIVR